MGDELERAVALLGPLEGRIMHAVWSGRVGEVFVVRQVQALMPELAYTTVMTTLRRLADKGLLAAQAEAGRKAHIYRAALRPEDHLSRASAREAADVVERYGEAALAAFAAQLAQLTPEQRARLRELSS
ncbi:BlaI/MecI/CopY family transcriptional regulator [Nonomuraea sp. NPDC026600]|uniref:BlaI/MecI/CopY family transcriptional regulator n=1 Tax=Nonomuraea sp. NPDC026600 TaxID=3155363 RepID=UPI0033CA5409